MADLLNTFANAYPYDPNSVWRGAQGVQNVMSNALDYQQKREAMEAARGLRALYAENPNPSYEDIAKISPEFAMQQNKANFEMQKEMLGMKETQGKINKQQQEEIQFFANAVGPVVEQYLMNTGGEGNQQQQAALKQQIGAGLRDIEQKTGMRPTNADALLSMSPSEMLNRLMLNGYQSPIFKGQFENQMAVQREGMMRGLPPAMTPQQAYGGVEKTPYGFMRVPGIGGQSMTPGPQYGVTPFNPNAGQMQQGPMPGGMQQAPIGAEDLGILKQNRAQMQPGPERDALDRMIAEVETGRVAQPPAGGFVTPQQEQQMRIEEEQARANIATKAAGERKALESEVERKESKQKAMDAFALIPSLPEMETLIAGSTSGKRQTEMAAQFEDWTGKATPGMKNIGRLGVIAGRLRDAVNRAPGSQSDKDAIIESLKTGDISNPELSAEKRLEAYREFVRQMRKMIKNETGIDAEPLAKESTTQTPVRVKTRADVEALPSGTLFMGDDGVMHRRK